jgi:3',5'-cyclic-AMP phosphodiesterase
LIKEKPHPKVAILLKTKSMRQIAFIIDVHLDEQFPIDNHVDTPKNYETVLSDIKNRGITEVIFGGDIGAASSHKYFFEKLKNLSLSLILGNHDTFEDVKEYFVKDKTKDALYYKTEDAYYQWFFLDSSTETLSETQLDWLQNELDESKELILFVHHPVLGIDTQADRLYPLKNREELQSILLNFDNKVTIFCGHYHMNDEQEFKNIKQYVTQSLSFQLERNAQALVIDNSNFGYRILIIDHKNIETKLVQFQSSQII